MEKLNLRIILVRVFGGKKELNSLDFFGGCYLMSSYLVILSKEFKMYKCKTQMCETRLPPPGEKKRRKLVFQ